MRPPDYRGEKLQVVGPKHRYNYHRAHTALGGLAPVTRVNNPSGKYT